MGEVVVIDFCQQAVANGRRRTRMGETTNEGMLQRLGECAIECPPPNGWIVTINTTIEVEWFYETIIVFRNHLGNMTAAPLLWKERLNDGRVCLSFDLAKPWHQNGGAKDEIDKMGFFLVTPTDEWVKLAVTDCDEWIALLLAA